MKVSNALSQEIVLENLLQKAIGLIQENTSAEKIYLLMESEEKNELEVIVQLTERGFSAGDKTTQFSNFDENTSEMIRYTCQVRPFSLPSLSSRFSSFRDVSSFLLFLSTFLFSK
jgi:hypothetical protein